MMLDSPHAGGFPKKQTKITSGESLTNGLLMILIACHVDFFICQYMIGIDFCIAGWNRNEDKKQVFFLKIFI